MFFELQKENAIYLPVNFDDKTLIQQFKWVNQQYTMRERARLFICAFVMIIIYTWLGRAAASVAVAVVAAAIHRVFASVHFKPYNNSTNLTEVNRSTERERERVNDCEREREQSAKYITFKESTELSVNKGIKYAGRHT